jgi:ubiquinone/menaquinone biosynthesis C-methylase UbiE
VGDSDSRRGLDGLTADELAESRRAWWDESFTEVLLRRVPVGTKQLVDVGCGLATAAHALLPKLPAMTYVGIDADPERIEQATKLLAGAPYRHRVELRVGRAENLPFREGEAEAVLIGMMLMHVPDPGAALREAARVLRPGGRLMAVEPDQTGIEVYFDGVLEGVTAAYRDLYRALRRQRRPADMALGPAIAALVEREKLRVDEFFPYAVGRTRRTTAGEFLADVAEGIRSVAASLPPDAPEIAAFRAAVAARVETADPSAAGYGCWLVPLFVCVAQKV